MINPSANIGLAIVGLTVVNSTLVILSRICGNFERVKILSLGNTSLTPTFISIHRHTSISIENTDQASRF